MAGDGTRAGVRRGSLAVLAVLAVVLVFVAGLWTVSRIDPTAARPQAEPTSEPAEEAVEEEPLRVAVEPRRVPAGTRAVRVTAFCAAAPAETTAQSGAFVKSPVFARSPSGAAMSADATLDPALPPGRHHVFARCGTRFGTAELEITQGPGRPERSEPERSATTRIALSPARPGDWRDHPDGEPADTAVDPGETLFRIQIVHEVRVPADDPDVAAVRAGAAARDPGSFVAERLGAFEMPVSGFLLHLAYSTPVVRTQSGSREAVITYTGVHYGVVFANANRAIGIEYQPPANGTVPRPTAHEIVVTSTGWTVAGVSGPPPLAQDAHLLRLNGGDSPIRVAFAEDGRNASVAHHVVQDGRLATHLEGSDPVEQEVEDGETVSEDWYQEESITFLGRVWTASLTVGLVAAGLILLYTLARALGGAWWRRPRNGVLAALVGGAGGVSWFASEGVGVEAAVLAIVVGAPVLALHSTFRAAQGHSDLPVKAAAVFAALAGLVLAAWPLAASFGAWPAAGVLAVAAGGAGVTAAVPGQRRRLPRTGLALLGTGVMLAGMAVVSGLTPPHLLWQALLLLGWFALVFGWATEASHRWSATSAARWVVAASVVFGVLVYAMTVLDSRSSWMALPWDDLTGVAGTVAFIAAPLLALVMLVVRVRRLGQGPAGLTEPVAFHTAMFFLLLMRVQAGGAASGLLVLLVWVGVFVLLPPPRAELLRPVQVDEHRLLVRDLIRRRSARAALTALLREPGAGDDFEQRRQALEQAGDEREGPLDSDLALTTLAGRTPWQNGLVSLGVGAVLSLPYSVVRIAESVRGQQTGATELAAAVLALLSLPVLSMVFGYFYPRVRGTHPIAKSLAFFLTALLVELPTYVYTLVMATILQSDLSEAGLPTADEALIGVLVAVGNIAVVSIGLGLWWEWRLMWLAGEPWGRIRDVRTLRALAAPLAAVAIAIATTAATALVNNVIAPLPSGPAVQATPTPSPSRSP
ncbi:hypothetical protein [Nonomuraea sp. NPDC050202]|uniref:hypothetical protein n=1 Tax=Nonomuraea sp. NPDC050202 TaxID=3155035 RepID=UPI0033F5C3FF